MTDRSFPFSFSLDGVERSLQRTGAVDVRPLAKAVRDADAIPPLTRAWLADLIEGKRRRGRKPISAFQRYLVCYRYAMFYDHFLDCEKKGRREADKLARSGTKGKGTVTRRRPSRQEIALPQAPNERAALELARLIGIPIDDDYGPAIDKVRRLVRMGRIRPSFAHMT